MSRHQTFDDMLEQLDRFIESPDAKTPAVPTVKEVEEAPLEVEFCPEEQERKASIRWKIPT